MRVLCVLAVLAGAVACGGNSTAQLKEVQRAKAGAFDVVVLSPDEALKQGKGNFVLEFRDAAGNLVDAGTVTVGATMPMAGMAPMIGDCQVTPADAKGRYNVASDLSMAGTWRVQVTWDGPAGKGSVSLPGRVL